MIPVKEQLQSLALRVRAAPHAALCAAVLAGAAYLCLVNLDYAALWHDEAPTAVIAKNLLEQGDIVGWDGRNLIGGTNGRTLNEDLRDVLPPLMYVLTAAAFSVVGVNEFGARIVPALIGIASLVLLCALLRERLESHPRLVLLALVFAAWSPQLLLFFRQSRYYALMVFTLIAAFHLYKRYWRTRSPWCLAGLTLITVLAFFNHYIGGATIALSLATWHVSFRVRETTRRQWLAFAVCGGFVDVVGAAYLVWIGVLGGERSGFLAYTGRVRNPEYESAIPVILFRLWIYTREVFTADWISWPVFAWFLGMLAFMLLRRRRDSGAGDAGPPARKPGRSRRGKRPARGAADFRMAPSPPDAPLPVLAVAKIVLVGALFVFYSALLSVQPVSVEYVADLRYFVGALPLLLVMKGLFVEWVWSHSRVAGGAALAALLLSSVGAAPFNVKMVFTGERTLGLHLPWFVGEVHRPYRASIRAVSDFLHEHAARDDLVYVASFPYREAMTFAAGDHVRFCCVLDENTPLPRERIETLGPWIRTRGVLPDWIVIFGPLHKAYWEKVRKRYRIVAQLDVHPYPTQRPEINVHAFSPLRKRDGISILRRRTGEQS